jgi:hypothetical protein
MTSIADEIREHDKAIGAGAQRGATPQQGKETSRNSEKSC